jgi:hypothetical protein
MFGARNLQQFSLDGGKLPGDARRGLGVTFAVLSRRRFFLA